MTRREFSSLEFVENGNMKKSVNRKKFSESSLRNFFALGFASFFTDMSSEMVFSLIPTFLLSLPGSSKAVLGLIEGTAEALTYILRAVSRIFSDKFRKRNCLCSLDMECQMR
jgi:Na+-driven multidrug efflux pump